MASSPDVADLISKKGATLLLLDVPEGTEFGIDFQSWYVGPRFKGMKMIPCGPHFFFYSAVDKYGNHALRNGVFLYTVEEELIVKKWNKLSEDFFDDEILDEELASFRADLNKMDGNLGPYPYEKLKKWMHQTCFISKETFSRVNPPCKKLTPLTEIDCTTIFTKKEMEKLSSNLPSQDTQKLLGFTKIPKQRYPDGASPTEITKYSMDSTFALNQVLSNFENQDYKEILGEAQFAFVAFLLGHVYDAFEQWKIIVHLLCSCVEALDSSPGLFCSFVDMLYHQLQEIPQDFFVDIVSQNNFLVETLKVFLGNFQDPGEHLVELEKKVERLKELLTSKFKWDFETQNPEDEPVIVEI